MEYFVFLPGIMGSHLNVPDHAAQDAGKPVWPPTFFEVAFTGYQRFHLLVRSDLEAPEIIGNVSICDFYGGILGDLDRVAAARTADANLQDAMVIRFPYDWRLDLRVTAQMLSARLNQIVQDDPSAQFTLICHSMGGLLGRYLLESGDFAGADWNEPTRLNRLIAIATPHDGAPLALDRILGNDETLGITGAQFAQFAAMTEFPSGYQLVPGEDAAFVRDETEGVAVSRSINPFGEDFVQTFGLQPDNIAANRALRGGLNLTNAPCDYVFFAGTGQETKNGMRRIGISAEAVVDQTGGDETVPSYSASTHRVATRYVKATHIGILQNLAVRRTLFQLLGAPRDVRPVAATGAETGAAPIEDISVPTEPVMASPTNGDEPESMVRLTINLRDSTSLFNDRLRFDPVVDPEAPPAERIEEARREEHDILYEGPDLDSLTISVPAPKRAGIYTVSFANSTADNPTSPRIMVRRRS